MCSIIGDGYSCGGDAVCGGSESSVWVGCVSSGVVVRFILLPSPDSVAPKALFSTFSNRERDI